MKNIIETLTEALKVGSKSKVSSNDAQTFKDFEEKYDCDFLARRITGIFKDKLLKVFNLTYIMFVNIYQDKILGNSLSSKYRFSIKKDIRLLTIKCVQRNNATECAYANLLKGKDNDDINVSWWIDSKCDESVEATFVKIFENIINLKL